MPLPEPIATELEVIDAALAGEAVDPEFAELAELALLLADSRPVMSTDLAERLDRRVSGLASAPARARVPRPHRSWIFRPAFGAGLAAVAAAVVVVVLAVHSGGPGASRNSALVPKRAESLAAVPAATSTSASAANPTASAHGSSSAGSSASASAASGVAKQAPPLGNLSSTQAPTPQANGRRIVQSAQLTLSAPDARIDTVAQELFTVVGAEAGIVKHSQISSGSGGYASFTLSIPTSNLSTTLSRLAQLRYAHVSSSTESSTDVNSQYLDDARALADAKALRTSLLQQLAAATTTADIDSLKAQIEDAEKTIATDEGTVNTLQGKISFTSVGVQIDAGADTSPGRSAGSGGFTLHRGAHDALTVLTVAGGVVLISLAVIVPLAIIVGLVGWLWSLWRRHGRERALDAA